MGYITNSPDEGSIWETKDYENFPPIFLLPRWIYEAFTAKHNLVDLHDYSKLRRLLSLEDLAQLEAAANHLNGWLVGENSPTSYADAMTYSSHDGQLISLLRPKRWGDPVTDRPLISDEQLFEVENTILPMSRMPSITKDIVGRLTGLSEEQQGQYLAVCEDEHRNIDDSLNGHHGKQPDPTDLKGVQVVLHQTSLYIVVEEGFLALLEDSVSKLTFFRQVLKSAYAVAPIRVVNRSVWYKQYLKALKA